MNDKDKLISFINKGKENNPVKEVHVIKDSDTENHILLVNEDGTSIASNKFEVGGASGGEIKNVSIDIETETWDVSQVDTTKDKIIFIDGNIATYEQINFLPEEYGYRTTIKRIYPDMASRDNSMEFMTTIYKLDGTMYYIYEGYNKEENMMNFFSSNTTTGEKYYNIISMIVPTLPDDASTKTYTLKAVNGVLTWVV